MQLEIRNTFTIWNGTTGSMSIPRGIQSVLKHFTIAHILDLLGAQEPVDWNGYIFLPDGLERDDNCEPVVRVKVYKRESYEAWEEAKETPEPEYTLLMFKI